MSAAMLLVAVSVSLVALGCESTAWRAFSGARHYAAGNVALSLSDGDRAIAELEQAADLVPHASEIQNHLGLAYRSVGREEAARAAFEAALVLDCDNVAARANLEGLGGEERESAKLLESGSSHGG